MYIIWYHATFPNFFNQRLLKRKEPILKLEFDEIMFVQYIVPWKPLGDIDL